MATLQLDLKQVNFDAAEYSGYEYELEDPISTVVDANTDFEISHNKISVCDSFTSQADFSFKTKEDLNSTTEVIKSESRKSSVEKETVSPFDLPQVHDKSSHIRFHGFERNSTSNSNGDYGDPSYPGISPEVARYVYQMNPDVVTKVEAALKPDSKKFTVKTTAPGIAKSNLAYLTNTSDTFTLQQSIIGSKLNLVEPAKMANVHFKTTTPTTNQTTTLPNVNNTLDKNENQPMPTSPMTSTVSSLVNNDNKQPVAKTLHKFPPERITTVTERKPSWFSSEVPPSEASVVHKPPINKQRRDSASSRRSSQSSTMSCPFDAISTPRRSESASNNDSPIPDISPILEKSTITRSADSHSIGSTESAYSDKYELDSNYSDLLETQSITSNMSEMSSISGIEEEMFRIKKLLLEVPSLPDDHPDFHKRSVVFGRTGGIVMSDDCTEADRFVVSQEVFFELQREKANLEGQIETLRTQLDEFVNEKRDMQSQLTSALAQVKVQTSECLKEKNEREKLTSKLQFMQQMNKKTDGANAQLQVNLETKTTDLAQMKEEIRDLEECNARLRIDSEELRMDMENKDGAIQGLKSKIAELHVEAQLAIQAKIQAVNNQQLIKSEMEALQKSREWYQQQLHTIQESRNKLQQDFLNLQGQMVGQKNEIEKLRTENVQTKQLLTDTQQRAVKEKETLMRHLESIKADMLEREATFAQMQADKGVVEESLMSRMKNIQDEKSKLTDVAMTVSDLEEQIAHARAEISAKNEGFKTLEVNYVQTMRKLTVAEKNVNERDLEIQRKDEKCMQLEQKVKELQMLTNSKDEQVNTLQDAKTAIEIALAAANKEKRDVDEALNIVRENLVKLDANFKKMKADLANRDINIDQLLKEKNRMEEALMSSEQKIIAFKSSYENYASELKLRDGLIEESKESMTALMQELKNERQQVNKLEGEVVKMRNEKASVAKKCVEFEDKIVRMDEELRIVKSEKKDVESQLEKFLASALTSSQVINSDESPNSNRTRVRRNSQDLSDGTKILKNSFEGSVTESYPRDELEREILLMRQALETREKQVEKYLQDKNNMQHVIETLQRENASLSRELTTDMKKENDKEQLSHQIEIQLQVYKRKVKELEHVLELTGMKKQNVNIETQTDNVSFMKHVLEQDDRNSVTQSRFEGLELEYRERQRIYDSNIKVLTRKLKEVMKAHKKAEMELKNWRVAVSMNQSNGQGQGDLSVDKQNEKIKLITVPDLPVNQNAERNLKREILHYKAKIKGLQIKLKESQSNYEDMKNRVEANKEAMLDLERERGKLTGVNQSNEALKSHTQRLESALAEKDVAVTELDIAKKDLTFKQEEEELRNKQQIDELEINLTAEKETAKELRKQIFNAKRESSSLRKQVSSLRTGLDNANQLVEMKKKEIDSLIEKLTQKKETEMKLINQYECLGADHRRSLSEIEQLKQHAIESQTKDGLLAEQLKNLGWHLRQKNQELTALKEQLTLIEERHKKTSEGLQKSLHIAKTEIQGLKEELEVTRKDKFNYQNAITELKTALKASFEANKALRAQTRQVKDNVLDIPILESPVPYDETLINSLLEQSAFTPQSRPLSDLQSCLNTLKEEMAILQEQLSEQDFL